MKKQNGSYIGHGEINDTGDGQTATATRSPGKTAVFKFRSENVGFQTDDFSIDACGTQPVLRPRYFRGDRNVTKKVIAGTFTFRNVDPGEATPTIRAEVKVRNDVLGGFTLDACVTATGTNPNDSDSPSWEVEVP